MTTTGSGMVVAPPRWEASWVSSASAASTAAVSAKLSSSNTSPRRRYGVNDAFGIWTSRVDLQQLLLVEALQHVAEAHDHRLVGEHPDALAVVPVPQVVEQAAHAQHHVGPALPARRLVVELAEPRAAGGLLGMPGADPRAGQAVEDAEVALAQPLVEDHLDAAPPHRALGRLGGPAVRRAQHDASAAGLVRARQPRADRVRLVAAGRGELHVGVPHVEVEPLGARASRAASSAWLPMLSPCRTRVISCGPLVHLGLTMAGVYPSRPASIVRSVTLIVLPGAACRRWMRVPRRVMLNATAARTVHAYDPDGVNVGGFAGSLATYAVMLGRRRRGGPCLGAGPGALLAERCPDRRTRHPQVQPAAREGGGDQPGARPLHGVRRRGRSERVRRAGPGRPRVQAHGGGAAHLSVLPGRLDGHGVRRGARSRAADDPRLAAAFAVTGVSDFLQHAYSRVRGD